MPRYYRRQQITPHPVLVDVMQTAANQIMFTYDQRADLASATNVMNYWIRSNMGAAGIATVDMKGALTAENSLRPNMAMITAVDSSMMRFALTFTANIMPGVMYTLLPCFVNLERMTGYRGENWGPMSRNMFVGM